MTKEQIYVHIKSEDEAKRAKDILEKWGEDIVSGKYFWFNSERCFLKIDYVAKDWYVELCNPSFIDELEKITLDELDQLLAKEHGTHIGSTTSKENLQVPIFSGKPISYFDPQPHYKNNPKQFRSLYELQTVLELNSYEFDILKRLVRCRKKGQFAEDLQKIKDTVDIYLNEFKS